VVTVDPFNMVSVTLLNVFMGFNVILSVNRLFPIAALIRQRFNGEVLCSL
jgi:hypothetical protein